MSKLFIEVGFVDEERQLKYGKEFLFISKLYSRFISSIKIENLQKIAIQLVNSPDSTKIMQANKLTQVCLIYKYFELNSIDAQDSEIKRFKVILDFIVEGILEVSNKLNWPIDLFKTAYNELINTGFDIEYSISPPKSSRNRRYCASIQVVTNKNYSTISIELVDNRSIREIKKIEIAKISFHESDLSSIANKLKWIDNDEIVISNAEAEIHFKYSIKKNSHEILLTPRKHDEEYLLDELKLLDPNTSTKEYLDIIQRRISKFKAQ